MTREEMLVLAIKEAKKFCSKYDDAPFGNTYGSIYDAIKEYKGGNKNLKSTNKCYTMYKEMKI